MRSFIHLCVAISLAFVLQPHAWAQAVQAKPTAPSNCESIRAQIDSKIAANGVKGYSVTVVDAATHAAGRVVGSCDRGSKKIIYSLSQSTSSVAKPAPAATQPIQKPTSKPIITECADGRVVTAGDCSKKP